MSPMFSLCVLFLSCSAASRSHDFTLCDTLVHWSDVISTPSKYITTQKSLTYLHSLPCFNLCVNREKNVFYRAIHSINIASFMTDIITSDLVTHPKEHVSDLCKQYSQILKTLLDKHAPIKSKSGSQKPPAPWMTPEIIQSKRRRRYLERVWRKSRSSLDRSRYTRQCHLCNSQMSKPKSYYYENMVSNNSATPKQLWKCINQILHGWPAPSLPTHASIESLCNSFSSHFIDKISLIHSVFTDHTSDIVNADSPQLNSQLASFEPATTAEVRKIIMSSPSKCCDLDPLPTVLLKACLDVLIQPITYIINASL